MDVSFTNVLEGARQYFQGLPAATSSTAGPTAYSSSGGGSSGTTTSEHHANTATTIVANNNDDEADQSSKIPANYWQQQQPSSMRDQPHQQRPTSSHDHQRRTPTSASHYYPTDQQHQSFQFPRPHSREAPSNQYHVQQQQQQQQHSPVVYQQTALSPVATASRQQDQIVTPSSSSSSNSSNQTFYHNLQSANSNSESSPHNYQHHGGYQQQTQQQHSRGYYPGHSQSKLQGNHQDSSYYLSKQHNTYSVAQGPSGSAQMPVSLQQQQQQQNVNPKATVYTDSYQMHENKQDEQQQQLDSNNSNTTSPLTQQNYQTYRTTHNLPPIAPLSANYHSNSSINSRNSNRDLTRIGISQSSSTRGGPTSNASIQQQQLQQHSQQQQQQQQKTISNNVSHIQQNSLRLATSSYQQQQQQKVTASNIHSGYRNSNYLNQPQTINRSTNQYYPQYNMITATTTTTSCNNVIMTTAISSNTSCTVPVQSHSSSNNQQQHYYHHSNKILTNNSHDVVQQQRNQQLISQQQPSLSHNIIERNSDNIHNRLMPIIKQKRESPLDLSVKTVRTSADSTDDTTTEHDHSNRSAKIYPNSNNNRTTTAILNSNNVAATHNYPTYDVYPSQFERNLTTTSRSTQQLPTATAPKVEFHPNFNVGTTTTLNNNNNCRISDKIQMNSSNSGNNSQQRLPTYNNHNNNTSTIDKIDNNNYQSLVTNNRYISNNNNNVISNSYNVQTSSKRVDNLPRIDFPPPGHGHKTTASYPVPTHDMQRKRPADTAPTMLHPNKMPKTTNDSWRETIDLQIEQRFTVYKQQHQHHDTTTTTNSTSNNNNNDGGAPGSTNNNSKSLMVNGSYQDRPINNNNNNTYQRQQQYNQHHHSAAVPLSHHHNHPHQPNQHLTYNPKQYNTTQNSHNQTYVPSAVAHHYPSSYPSSYSSPQQQQSSSGVYQQQHYPPSRTNHLPSSMNLTNNNNTNNTTTTIKNNFSGANKKVLSLLRNSLEIKGAKEAQRKLEKEHQLHQQHQYKYDQVMSKNTGTVRSDVQHPSTDVTAPLQPRPIIIGRHNISPFTPDSGGVGGPSSSTLASLYKLHIPKAIDSVNFGSEINKPLTEQYQRLDDSNQLLLANNHVATNTSGGSSSNNNTSSFAGMNNNSNSDLDGFAAFLAARIRTKAELKQVGPHSNNNCNNAVTAQQMLHSNNNTTPIKEQQDLLLMQMSSSSGSSPPKLMKEQQQQQQLQQQQRQAFAPRRRLFSRSEDDLASNGANSSCSNVPHRDKSGLRSSSETSVFDFPDSDSETEMPVLERQSLEDMRRDRKSFTKQPSSMTTTDVDVNIESAAAATVIDDMNFDDLFTQTCDNFVEQLKKSGNGKKRGRRKKMIEADVLAKLESVTREKPLLDDGGKVMRGDEDIITLPQVKIEQHVDDVGRNSSSNNNKDINDDVDDDDDDSDSDAPLSNCKSKIMNKDISDNSGSSDNEVEVINESQNTAVASTAPPLPPPSTTITTTTTKKGNNSSESKLVSKEPTESTTITQSSSASVMITRPAKKPCFGDGSDFYPGWEEEVYKYKKSLRMPPSLIQVTRPPHYHRLSTSLPDLDPSPTSPFPLLGEFTKKLSKIKQEQLNDSDTESNCSFNLFSSNNNNKKGYDSEGGSSISSLSNNVMAANKGFLDKLLQRYCVQKRRKYNKRNKDDGNSVSSNLPKIIPKSDKEVELLPTPSLHQVDSGDNDKKTSRKNVTTVMVPILKQDNAGLLGFRKKTINNFKNAFIKNNDDCDIILKSRTRKQTRVLKQKATIKEVFGEDRPASAPPVTCLNNLVKIIKDEETDDCNKRSTNNIIKKEDDNNDDDDDDDDDIISQSSEIDILINSKDSKTTTKQVLKNRLLNRGRKRDNFLKVLVEKKIKSELLLDDEKKQLSDITGDNKKKELTVKDEEQLIVEMNAVAGDNNDNDDDKLVVDIDCKSEETPSIDGDDVSGAGVNNISSKKRNKFRNIRRKFSSGFDYIRKKKKQVKKDITTLDHNELNVKPKRRGILTKSNPESVQDIQKEIKTWVLNKGIGETHLHRSARLGYTDIAAYCLEKMECIPSPKDNAGYTPLHEASARGHLDIAKLLLLYGANVSESARGGVRPLHEAVENGYVEVVRLLLSYGADPMLATYNGSTPLALVTDETTKTLLQNHINDMQGITMGCPWLFTGPSTCFDPDESGFNIFDDVPAMVDDVTSSLSDNEGDSNIEFEVSDTLLPNLYTLRGEQQSDRWILLQDLSNLLKIKSRDALLRQICNSSSTSSNTTTITSNTTNYKSVLRELKMSDFLEQAHCCQFLNIGEKINTRASKIALVKYTDQVKELLNVERVLIAR